MVQITVGPPVLTINRSSTFAVSDYRGEIDPDRPQGIFAADTRFVSTYRLFIDGERWQQVTAAAVDYHTARVYLVNPPLPGVAGEASIAQGTLALMLVRDLAESEATEVLEVANYSGNPVDAVLSVEVASDFADLFEVKQGKVKQRGDIVTRWNHEARELSTTYRKDDYWRCFTYRVEKADTTPSYANGRLLFPVHLEPGTACRAHLRMLFEHDGGPPEVGEARPEVGRKGEQAAELHEQWVQACTGLHTPDRELATVYRQSVEDMGALRLLERDLGPDVWVPAAGVPWFVALFGRDSLIASLQNMMVHARFAEGALRVLAKYQAEKRDDWRDAQPGKIMHELRHGELAHFNMVPQTPYYGTWDATPLYLITLHEAWRWLGDRDLVKDLLPTAERCLEWIDQSGDLDGDGFQEYRTFSQMGFQDMCWKDSGKSIVYPDGSEVQQPKGTCELQGYVYAAKRGMAEVFAEFGDQARADTLRRQAADLKRRFNETFWMEEKGTFALALDGRKNRVESVASNAGHCLWAGIADEDKARKVADRLLTRDMWSGWGVRTLSAGNPAYNPYSYQRGAIWPHDNGIIAMGLKRYGFAEQAGRVARGILDAAARFQSYRLPEVFAGLDREENPFPVQYRGANIPQAWGAGSIFQMVRAITGLRADVPQGRLWVSPSLPAWLPSLTLDRLEVGGVRLSIRFWREDGKSRFEVLKQEDGELQVSLDESPSELI
ncbi:MAG: amylo-alpha-1,6-glucosidase [Chloroflexota bacterium]